LSVRPTLSSKAEACGVQRRKPPMLAIASLMAAALSCLFAYPAPSNELEATGDDFQFAVARRGCTQEDAPAIEIFLSKSKYLGSNDPPAPYIRIEVSSTSVETISDVTVHLVSLSRESGSVGRIARAELVDDEGRHQWLSGLLRIASLEPNEHVAGRYDFESRLGPIRGSFRGSIVRHQAICG
jgi:hypothetical protein